MLAFLPTNQIAISHLTDWTGCLMDRTVSDCSVSKYYVDTVAVGAVMRGLGLILVLVSSQKEIVCMMAE